MSEPVSPKSVLKRLIQGIAEQRWPELHELYAADAVVEYPFALPAPIRLAGRGAIQRYFAGVARMGLRLRARNLMIHETADAEVVVVEYDYDGLLATTGREFQLANIQVTRVRDGLIVSSRDYHNHAVLTEVLGRLPEVLAALGLRLMASD
jgi:ketosteroid isomerase-like protein